MRRPPTHFDEALLDAEAAHDDEGHADRLREAMRGENDFLPETYRRAREQLSLEAIR